MDKDRGLTMNNDEQGLQTRLAAHARAQAQAGSGNLGAVKRALNNGIAAGTGNLTKTQRGIATARGQKANEILAKNSGPIADQLGAALLKGPSAIHMKSAAVEETRQENAYKQARSGADSWSGAFTRRMNSFVSSVASVARSVLPERFSHGITQYAQERQEATRIGESIESELRGYQADNKDAFAAEDTATNSRMVASAAGVTASVATAASGATGGAALGIAAAGAAVKASALGAASIKSSEAGDHFERTVDLNASGRDLFHSNVSSERSAGNRAQAHKDMTDAGKALIAPVDQVKSGVSSKIGKAIDYFRGTSTDMQKIKRSNAESARNLAVAARLRGTPENPSESSATLKTPSSSASSPAKPVSTTRPEVGALKKNVGFNYQLESALRRGPSEAVTRSQRQESQQKR